MSLFVTCLVTVSVPMLTPGPDTLFCPATSLKSVWAAKPLFTMRDHPDLQAEPSADARDG
jgi:hypothetical protein